MCFMCVWILCGRLVEIVQSSFFLYGVLAKKKMFSVVVYCLMVMLLQIQCCFAPLGGMLSFFFSFFFFVGKEQICMGWVRRKVSSCFGSLNLIWV